MLSDVLLDAADGIDDYLNDPSYADMYSGTLKDEIIILRDKMRAAGLYIGRSPSDNSPSPFVDKPSEPTQG